MSDLQSSTPQPGQPPVAHAASLPAWAAAPSQLVWRESPPLQFHQLLRGAPRYSWWRPLLGVLLGAVFYIVFSLVFAAIVLIPYGLSQGSSFTEASILELAVLDAHNPISLIFGFGSIAMMLPAVFLAMLCSGLRPTGRLWSAALKIRWGLLGRTVIPALISMIVTQGVGYLVLGITWLFDRSLFEVDPATTAEVSSINPNILIASLVIGLLVVPFQATAEEVVFRGAFMQAIGAWLYNRRNGRMARFFRSPILPIVLPSVLFGFGHIYEFWGWMAVVSMALVLGWLSVRTGGLEAAVTLHVLNNLTALTLMVFAVGGQTTQASDNGGPATLIGLLAGLAVYAWLVTRVFKKSGEHNTRVDYVQVYEPIVAASAEVTVPGSDAAAVPVSQPQNEQK